MHLKPILFVICLTIGLHDCFLFWWKKTTTSPSTTTKTITPSCYDNTERAFEMIPIEKITEFKLNATKYQQYRVVRVSDGDTLTAVGVKNMHEIRVRLKCVDAPEMGQAFWGDIASKTLLRLVPRNSKIRLESTSVDQYYRIIGEVINQHGINVNKKMLEFGMSVLYTCEKGCEDYKSIEDLAKKNMVGVWNDKSFEMPWDYRRKNQSFFGVSFEEQFTQH